MMPYRIVHTAPILVMDLTIEIGRSHVLPDKGLDPIPNLGVQKRGVHDPSGEIGHLTHMEHVECGARQLRQLNCADEGVLAISR